MPVFRTDIQALRAIAVLLVLAFHVRPAAIPGGYVGVDVFFVISGYLITGHLLREVASTGHVRLPTFYARRACRLLPAASLTLVAVGLATYLWMPAFTWSTTAADMATSALYAENWMLLWRSVDYLAQDAAPSPLQHFWSLAVEEQFYLGWPLVVPGVAAWWRRRGGKPALPGLPPSPPPRVAYALPMAAISCLSFACALHYARTNPAAGYFMTHVRLFELGLGGLLGVWAAGEGPVLPPWLASCWPRMLAAAAGLAAIGASAFTYTTDTPFPGVAALVPVLGAVTFIAAGEGVDDGTATPAHTLVHLLSHPWLQYTGDISYSLYLAHWPVVVVYPFGTGRAVDGSAADGVTVLVMSWALAHACKWGWEDRFRWVVSGVDTPDDCSPKRSKELMSGVNGLVAAVCRQFGGTCFRQLAAAFSSTILAAAAVLGLALWLHLQTTLRRQAFTYTGQQSQGKATAKPAWRPATQTAPASSLHLQVSALAGPVPTFQAMPRICTRVPTRLCANALG